MGERVIQFVFGALEHARRRPQETLRMTRGLEGRGVGCREEGSLQLADPVSTLHRLHAVASQSGSSSGPPARGVRRYTEPVWLQAVRLNVPSMLPLFAAMLLR